MGKKTSKKTTSDNSGKGNNNTKFLLIACVVISIIVLSLTFGMNYDSVTTSDSVTISDSVTTSSGLMDQYIDNLSNTHTIQKTLDHPHFDVYVTPDDDIRLKQGADYVDGLRIEFNEDFLQQYVDQLKPNDTDNIIVIYPIWTSAAYDQPGFYTYFRGDCDESCITDVSFENAIFEFNSSGFGAQILYHIGYDFLTEIEVDKNPELLENYDTVILLHNEYVTKKVFNAIASHPNLIFLYPNALYAEIEVDHETNTMTLIRGHQYPLPERPANGFDYDVEMQFHNYEYDIDCLDWEFIEIPNGFHLNCYPDGNPHAFLEILVTMKELI